MIDVKPLRIRFYKTDRYTKGYDRTRYSALFGSEIYDLIQNN